MLYFSWFCCFAFNVLFPISRRQDKKMLLEGQQLTQYRLIRRLKSGSRGEVYLAVDEHHHHVAIKVIQIDYSLYPDNDTAEEAVQHFLHEMQAIAQIEHPHILPLH